MQANAPAHTYANTHARTHAQIVLIKERGSSKSARGSERGGNARKAASVQLLTRKDPASPLE
jgi:hypothetical protein